MAVFEWMLIAFIKACAAFLGHKGSATSTVDRRRDQRTCAERSSA